MNILNCGQIIGAGLSKVDNAVATLGDVTAGEGFFSFGNLGPGVYMAKYLGTGAWGQSVYIPGTGWQTGWGVSGWFDVPNDNPHHLAITYQNGGTQNVSFYGDPAGWTCQNQACAEPQFVKLCFGAVFTHTGGDASLHFVNDGYYANGHNGSPNPSFQLYLQSPVFAIQSMVAGWTSGDNLTVTATIVNATGIAWPGITVSLQAVGGIAPGASVSGWSIGKFSTATVQLQCTASTVDLTPTLHFSDGISTYADLSAELLPVLKFTPPGSFSGPGMCYGVSRYAGNITISNLGTLGTHNLQVTLTATNGIQFVDCSNGNVSDSITISVGRVAPLGTAGSTYSMPFYVKAPAAQTATKITISPADSGTSFPTFTFDAIIP
jgi:hypothetical protein